MQEQIEFYKNLFQNCAVAIFVIETDHRVILWNKACEELTGISAHEIIGTTNQWRAFYSHRQPCLADRIIDGNIEKIPDHYNVYGPSALLPNGSHAEEWYSDVGSREKYLIFDAAPIYNVKGELIAAIETLEDITQQKRVESELQKVNQKLQRFADLDGLTGIANRRKFDAHLNLWWKQLRREQLPLSLIMCDIDYFKLYNDTYGHLAGDDCLRAIAKAIRLNFKRPADLVARYGGEEFAIILPYTDTTGVTGLCEAIRRKIEQLKMPHVLSSVGHYVTISVGASTMVPCDTHSPEFLVEAADKALYKAKERGRNCVSMNALDSLPNLEKTDKMRRGAEPWFDPVVPANVLSLTTELFQKTDRIIGGIK